MTKGLIMEVRVMSTCYYILPECYGIYRNMNAMDLLFKNLHCQQAKYIDKLQSILNCMN